MLLTYFNKFRFLDNTLLSITDIGEMWVASSVIDDFFIHPILFFSEIKDFQELSWRHLGLTDLRLSHADYYVLYYRTGTELTMKVSMTSVVEYQNWVHFCLKVTKFKIR